jgi:hypothetical protein
VWCRGSRPPFESLFVRSFVGSLGGDGGEFRPWGRRIVVEGVYFLPPCALGGDLTLLESQAYFTYH